jgi:hypothetical protein
MSTLSQNFSGNIKSIQRGWITIAANASSGTATISSTNTSKSVLRYMGILGSWPTGTRAWAGVGTGTTSYSESRSSHATLVLTNSTTLTATLNSAAGGGYSVYIGYEVTEYY